MENLSAERFVEMLKKDGIEVSVDQASSILKFLSMLADIVVDDYLKSSPPESDEEER